MEALVTPPKNMVVMEIPSIMAISVPRVVWPNLLSRIILVIFSKAPAAVSTPMIPYTESTRVMVAIIPLIPSVRNPAGAPSLTDRMLLGGRRWKASPTMVPRISPTVMAL